MKYKAVVYDLDGTLLDTLKDLQGSTNAALRAFGMPERTLEEVRSFVGNGVRRLMVLSVPDGDENPLFEEVFAEFKRHYAIHCNDTTVPYPGIFDLIDELNEMGVRQAIVSNKAQFAVDELNRLYFAGRIDVAIGENAGIRKKPAPDTVLESARRLEVDIKDCLYVGDSEVDIRTAENCGIDCACVTWGFRTVEELRRNGAVMLCDSPEDILRLVRE